ncbi:hypothetical protein [Bifidobacterium platyrrhinorum]|uniref:Uncharacterized protein n=1 Tax=Bifidobacterium platyrrhinorum TaxID=2661628 RepID=A0A6L9STM7_9BIFI|nr:hypothetical protein [Bifidobacterium platyrrhinorum]NEG55976.1 hypothetical protein [Bifidobacterium platyrrhinorum]
MTDDKTLDKTTNIRTMDTQAMPVEQSAAAQTAADKGFDDSRNRSLQDIVDTQAMPAPADVKPDAAPPTERVLDKPIPAVDQNADTAVFSETAKDPSAPVDLDTPLNRLAGVADDEPEPEPEPAAKPEPKAEPGSRADGFPPDGAVPPSGTVPPYARPQSGAMPPNPAAPPASARPAAASPTTIAPTGPSMPTILLGVTGILVGAFGLLLGLRLPDVTTWVIGVDPQTLTALFFGGVGVMLILVAVIWGIAKAVAGRGKRTGR